MVDVNYTDEDEALFAKEKIDIARSLVAAACDLSFFLDTFQCETGHYLIPDFWGHVAELVFGRDVESLTDAEVAFVIGTVVQNDATA